MARNASSSVNQAIGFVAGMLTTFAAAPQIYHMLKTRQGAGLSYGMLGLTTVGVCMWIVYGLREGLMPIVVWNCFALAMFATLLLLKAFYCDPCQKRNERIIK